MRTTPHKARDITARLRSDLQKGTWEPHSRFPSERVLSRTFAVSDITVRKALANLVAEGLVYRRERYGTYVSPPVKAGQMLLVMGEVHYTSGLDFLRAFAQTLSADGEAIFPLIIASADFLAHLEDLDLIYRDIGAVVFFRDMDALLAARETLNRKDIPFAFYGSDHVLGQHGPVNALLARERDIARLAFEHLGHDRPLALASARYPVHQERARIFRELARKARRPVAKGLDLELPFYEPFREAPKPDSEQGRWLRRVAEVGAAVFATSDQHGTRILQHAHRQGLAVPRDFRIVGVDNAPVGEALPVGLSSVAIPVVEDGERLCRRLLQFLRHRGQPFRETSRVHLVARESSATPSADRIGKSSK